MRQTVRAILINRRNELLLVQHDERNPADRDKWATVGGGLDPGEDHPTCLARELSEEFGISAASKVTIGPKLLTSERSGRVDHFYVVWFDGEDVTVQASDEILCHQWVSLEQATGLRLFFGFEIDLFKQALKLVR